MNYELDDQLRLDNQTLRASRIKDWVVGFEAALLEKYIPLAEKGETEAFCVCGKVFMHHLQHWLNSKQMDLWVCENGVPNNEEENPDSDIRLD